MNPQSLERFGRGPERVEKVLEALRGGGGMYEEKSLFQRGAHE